MAERARRRGPAGTPVTDRLNALTQSGALTPDPLQFKAAAALDRVATELQAQNGSRGFLGGLFGGPAPVRVRKVMSTTLIAIGTIMAAHAVFETHMLRNAVTAMKPPTIAAGRVPTRRRIE